MNIKWDVLYRKDPFEIHIFYIVQLSSIDGSFQDVYSCLIRLIKRTHLQAKTQLQGSNRVLKWSCAWFFFHDESFHTMSNISIWLILIMPLHFTKSPCLFQSVHVFFFPDLKRVIAEQRWGSLHSLVITLQEMQCKADLEPATNA